MRNSRRVCRAIGRRERALLARQREASSEWRAVPVSPPMLESLDVCTCNCAERRAERVRRNQCDSSAESAPCGLQRGPANI